jgi:uncharacterized protein (TIGR02246 family)
MRTTRFLRGLFAALAIMSVSADGVAEQPPAQESLGATRKSVEQVLSESIAAWNASDIDRFLSFYDDAPSTAIVARGKVGKGMPAIRSHYMPFSPEPGANGILSAEILDFALLGADYVLLTLRAHVDRAAGRQGNSDQAASMADATSVRPGVLATLLFHRTRAGWRIIYEHVG